MPNLRVYLLQRLFRGKLRDLLHTRIDSSVNSSVDVIVNIFLSFIRHHNGVVNPFGFEPLIGGFAAFPIVRIFSPFFTSIAAFSKALLTV